MSSCWNPDEISPDAFCDLVVAENIGGHGKEIFMRQFHDRLALLYAKPS